MKLMKKPVVSLIIISAITFAPVIVAEPAKCSPCQAARSMRDELKQSIKDAAAAALAAGGAYSREQELDIEKCGCGKPRTTRDELSQDIDKCGCSRTTRDEFSQDIEKCGCGKPRTTRDELSQDIDKCGCSRTTRDEFAHVIGAVADQELLKISIVEAAQEALAVVQALMETQLDHIPGVLRAPREELVDPCNSCEDEACELNPCGINARLKALACCCASLTQRVACHGINAKKFYKKLKNKIDDVEELVESVIDEVAIDSSVSDSALLSISAQITASASATDVLLLSIIDLLTLVP